MRHTSILVGLGLLLAACGSQPVGPAAPSADVATPAQASSQGQRVEVVPGEVIVKLREGATLEGLSAKSGVGLQSVRTLSGGEILATFGGGLSAQGEDAVVRAQAVVSALSAQAEVEYAQPNYVYRAMATPNDTYFNLQWHYVNFNLPNAWNVTTGAGSPVVAVLDTGKTAHPELNAKWVGGYDFISNSTTAADGGGRDSNATDPGDSYQGQPNSWHGTHVAGTIGAATNNGTGVAGVNWSARILPVRVLGKGGGSTADIADAIRWSAGVSVTGVAANAYPAKVINMSLGGYLGSSCATGDPTTQNAINAAVGRGATVVVAAGNDNDNAGLYSPASCNNTVTVAATEYRNYRAPYSNYGAAVDVAAPGGDTGANRNGDSYADGVLSTLLNSTGSSYNYSFYQGTSMAAPHIAGLVSLMYAVKPTITPAQVLSTLKSSATPLSSTACSGGCGSGLVDALKAVNGAKALP